MSDWDIHHGDALEVLKTLQGASFDAVLCDPPYGLKFMGKEWDHGVPNKDVWAEALRVLKPGAFLLAFGGTRTFHRLTCAIEDAGFEIRDCVSWLYGSGFPKSMDISKALDKAGGMSPRKQSELLRSKRESAGLSREDVARNIGCTPASVRDWEEGRSRAIRRAVEWITPSEPYRGKLANLLGYTADERRLVGVSMDRRGDGTVIGLGHSGVEYGNPTTDAARTWEGYGSALKPAWEPCIVAMKPLDGTFAENALRHGVSGLNIEAGRIDSNEVTGWEGRGNSLYDGGLSRVGGSARLVVGRWPANLILDEASAAALDLQAGDVKSGGGHRGKKQKSTGRLGEGLGFSVNPQVKASSGGPSRFFYTAKASRRERDAGTNGNAHPCLKPLDLNRYLASLILPPKRDAPRRILVPFSGSGSEMIGALMAGWDEAVGIEREVEYIAIAQARLHHWVSWATHGVEDEGQDEREALNTQAEIKGLPLFSEFGI